MPSRCVVDGRQLMDQGTLYCSIRCVSLSVVLLSLLGVCTYVRNFWFAAGCGCICVGLVKVTHYSAAAWWMGGS
jgi:hypothetical protein